LYLLLLSHERYESNPKYITDVMYFDPFEVDIIDARKAPTNLAVEEHRNH
jgi:hypothetical protein